MDRCDRLRILRFEAKAVQVEVPHVTMSELAVCHPIPLSNEHPPVKLHPVCGLFKLGQPGSCVLPAGGKPCRVGAVSTDGMASAVHRDL